MQQNRNTRKQNENKAHYRDALLLYTKSANVWSETQRNTIKMQEYDKNSTWIQQKYKNTTRENEKQ